nr:hypothetical protein [Angustibacter aerolatus]
MLLLDEPSTGLDPRQRHGMVEPVARADRHRADEQPRRRGRRGPRRPRAGARRWAAGVRRDDGQAGRSGHRRRAQEPARVGVPARDGAGGVVTAVVVWARRGAGRFVALGLLGVLASVLARPVWRLEVDWGVRLTAGALVMVCPCVAAAAAFDTGRRLRPTLEVLGRGGVRSRAIVVAPAVAVVLSAWAAFAVAWLAVAVVVLVHGGTGLTDGWVVPEVLAPLAAAGAVGCLAGMMTAGRTGAPLAALAVLAVTTLAVPWGRGSFEAVTTYGTLTGLQRPTDRALANVVGALGVALCAVLAAALLHRRVRGHGAILVAAAVLGLVATVAPAAWPWHHDVFVTSAEPVACVGRAPSVCGPASRREPAGAGAGLAGRRLPPPGRHAVHPSHVVQGHAARSLLAPARCRAARPRPRAWCTTVGTTSAPPPGCCCARTSAGALQRLRVAARADRAGAGGALAGRRAARTAPGPPRAARRPACVRRRRALHACDDGPAVRARLLVAHAVPQAIAGTVLLLGAGLVLSRTTVGATRLPLPIVWPLAVLQVAVSRLRSARCWGRWNGSPHVAASRARSARLSRWPSSAPSSPPSSSRAGTPCC